MNSKSVNSLEYVLEKTGNDPRKIDGESWDIWSVEFIHAILHHQAMKHKIEELEFKIRKLRHSRDFLIRSNHLNLYGIEKVINENVMRLVKVSSECQHVINKLDKGDLYCLACKKGVKSKIKS